MSSGRLPRIELTQAIMAVAVALITVSPAGLWAHAGDHGVQQAGQAQQGITTAQPSVPAREIAVQGPLTHPEEAAIRIPVDAYLRGHETGDVSYFRRAFAKDARLWWVRDGQVATRTTEEYIAAVSGRRSAEPGHRRRLVHLEITGETAIATISIEYPTVRLTDQLTLQRVGDEWRITTKTFSSEPRPTVS
jgi:hypothetical protein